MCFKKTPARGWHSSPLLRYSTSSMFSFIVLYYINPVLSTSLVQPGTT